LKLSAAIESALSKGIPRDDHSDALDSIITRLLA
jgi:hypothetical protein